MWRNNVANGFTLVELLVVIAIVAVLAAILFPVLAKARESARATTCSSNQRQISLTLHMWAQDHDETLPKTETIWQDLDLTSKLLICPTAGKVQRNGYVYNANVADRSLGDASFGGSDANVILTADGSTVDNVAYKRQEVDMRHNGKALASFLDGHVDRVVFAELSTYHVGSLVFKPVPFTSNTRYTASILPTGTTIACTGQPDHDWLNHTMSDLISDVPAGSYCRLEFTVPYPDRPFACGISYNPPYMSHGFSCNNIAYFDTKQISFWENPPSAYLPPINHWYATGELYAIERQPNGTVNYLANDHIIFTSPSPAIGALQFHFNGYQIGSEVRNLRYCVE